MIEFIHSHSATPLGYGPPYDRHRERKVDSMSNTPYQQPAPAPAPLKAMNNERALWKFIVFGLLTCGIYTIVFWSGIGEDLNIAATRRDGKKTMHYCLVLFLLGPITCSIYLFVWFHQMSERLGSEARARGFATDFGASTFWLWYVLGSLIIVGPFIYVHKLCTAMNAIANSYNANGI